MSGSEKRAGGTEERAGESGCDPLAVGDCALGSAARRASVNTAAEAVRDYCLGAAYRIVAISGQESSPGTAPGI